MGWRKRRAAADVGSAIKTSTRAELARKGRKGVGLPSQGRSKLKGSTGEEKKILKGRRGAPLLTDGFCISAVAVVRHEGREWMS